MSVSWLRLLVGEFAITASCVQANAKKEVFGALTAVVGFCERVLDVRGIDFVCLWPFWFVAVLDVRQKKWLLKKRSYA